MSNHRNTVDALNAELRGFNRKPVAASNVAPVVMSKLALALKEANAALHTLAFKLRAARKAGKKSWLNKPYCWLDEKQLLPGDEQPGDENAMHQDHTQEKLMLPLGYSQLLQNA